MSIFYYSIFIPFHATGLFLYNLETSENLWFLHCVAIDVHKLSLCNGNEKFWEVKIAFRF